MSLFGRAERKFEEANDLLTEIYEDYKKGDITAEEARGYIPLSRISDAMSLYHDAHRSSSTEQREKLKSLYENMMQTMDHVRGLGGRRRKTAKKRRARKTRRNR